MRDVILHGNLGEKFGRYHKFDVRTPAEAVRALCVNFPALEHELMTAHERDIQYKVFVGPSRIGADELTHPAGRHAIRIAPVVVGAKNGGLFQAILGVVLVAAGVFFAQPWLVNLGVGLIIGGVAQMLTKVPESDGPNEKDKNKPSYYFDGAVNTTAQGQPVPVGYGRMIIGSAVISAGIAVEEASI